MRPADRPGATSSAAHPTLSRTGNGSVAAERVRPSQALSTADPKDFRLTVNQPPNPVEGRNKLGGRSRKVPAMAEEHSCCKEKALRTVSITREQVGVNLHKAELWWFLKDWNKRLMTNGVRSWAPAKLRAKRDPEYL